MSNIITDGLNLFAESVNPEFRKDKKELRQQIHEMESRCSALKAVSIGAIVIGGMAFPTGFPLVLGGLSAGYMSYNYHKVAGNYRHFVDNPFRYVSYNLGSETINWEKLRDQVDNPFKYVSCDSSSEPIINWDKLRDRLRKDTVYFDWGVESFINNAVLKKK